MGHHLVGEEFAGDTILCELAKSGQGLGTLLESLALQSEILELRAPTEGPAKGTVIEARLDRGRGPVATVLVQAGTLRRGDVLVVDERRGRVRAMFDDRGQSVASAGPSTPVEIVGLDGVPSAGDELDVVESDRVAKQLAAHRAEQRRKHETTSNVVSIEEFLRRQSTPVLSVVLQADVHGAVEALRDAISSLTSDRVRVEIPSAGLGIVSESDVKLAKAAGAIIVGFNVRVDPRAETLAAAEAVDIERFEVIYEVLDRVRERMAALLEPEVHEDQHGQAEVRALFQVPKVGRVAGCRVTSGTVRRSDRVRVLRDGQVVHDGQVASLRMHQDDVAEVAEGRECGIAVAGFGELRVGDILDAYAVHRLASSL